MTDHSEQADRLEAQADGLAAQSDRLGEEIAEARDTWESHKADPAVPGAVGDAIATDEGSEPETTYPAKGDTDAAEDVPGGDGRRAGSHGDEDS